MSAHRGESAEESFPGLSYYYLTIREDDSPTGGYLGDGDFGAAKGDARAEFGVVGAAPGYGEAACRA
ncbi:MAG: hypothetical protein U5O16_24960 [Rhodococcus sp. (in: high G+C Gram-positive bacteria)]|uniref:hypothetical protein n=1 Tax=Rhodococcus sp. TaxID=1831 RepID=UPI002ADD0065|nr:hypothetical protein [Rhodococcus sp. (in: high G+C Gram-positive bacteria)]